MYSTSKIPENFVFLNKPIYQHKNIEKGTKHSYNIQMQSLREIKTRKWTLWSISEFFQMQILKFCKAYYLQTRQIFMCKKQNRCTWATGNSHEITKTQFLPPKCTVLSTVLTCDTVRPSFCWKNFSHSSKYGCKFKKETFLQQAET